MTAAGYIVIGVIIGAVLVIVFACLTVDGRGDDDDRREWEQYHDQQ